MPLESGTTIADLNASWPTGGDPKSEGDDHLRLLKGVIKNDVYPKAEVYDKTEVYTKAEADAEFSKVADIQTVEIVEANTTEGWQVWGDILIQWGTVLGDALGQSSVTFSQPFESTPIIMVTPRDVSSPPLSSTYTGYVRASNATGASFGGTTGTFGQFNVAWLAIGPAPVAFRKPKTVDSP